MTSAERIDALLREANMSRRTLATKAGIPTSTLQAIIERNTAVSLPVLKRISVALDVSLFDVLGDDERQIFIEATDSAFLSQIKSGYAFSSPEKLLVRMFALLNDRGKDEALERIGEMTELSKFRGDPK